MDCGPRRRRHSSAPPDRSSGARAAAGQSSGDLVFTEHLQPTVLRGCYATRPGPGHRPGQSQGGILLGVIELDRIKRINVVFRRQLTRQQSGSTERLDSPWSPVVRSSVMRGDTGAIPGLSPWGWSQHVPGSQMRALTANNARANRRTIRPAGAWNEKTTPEQANQGVILLKGTASTRRRSCQIERISTDRPIQPLNC